MKLKPCPFCGSECRKLEAENQKMKELLDEINEELEENPNDCRMMLNHYFTGDYRTRKGKDGDHISHG